VGDPPIHPREGINLDRYEEHKLEIKKFMDETGMDMHVRYKHAGETAQALHNVCKEIILSTLSTIEAKHREFKDFEAKKNNEINDCLCVQAIW
jgi:hypothetical protein